MTGGNRWPLVPLGEVLSHYREYIDRPEARQYPKLSVKLYGKGVVLDSPADGTSLKMQRHQIAKAGQVILSEIWGKKGAIGFVPDEGDGALCTSHFFLFDVHNDRIEPGWLQAIFRANYLAAQLGSQAFGTTGYAAVRPKALLAAEIPLPPLAEQRRIVAKIDSLAAKIDEAQELNNLAGLQSSLLAVAMAHRTDLSREAKEAAGWKEATLGDVIKTEFDDEPVIETENYPNFGIYSYGRGLFPKPPISGLATSATRLRRVHAGQFIYSRLFAWEGSFGLVTDEYDGWFVSGEYPTFCCDRSRILPEFLFAYFKAERAWASVALGSKGLGSRRQRVQPDQILAHKLLLPPMEVQLQIKIVIARDSEIVEARSALKNGIDALLPSILDRAFSGAL